MSRFWGTIFLMLFLASCAVTPRLSVVNIAQQYEGGGFTIPQVIAYHSNDTVTMLWVIISKQDFEYENAEAGQKYHSRAVIKCRLFSSYSDRHLIDSLSVVLQDSSGIIPEVQGWDTAEILLPARRGDNYVVGLDIKDEISGQETRLFYEIPKKNKEEAMDFRVYNEKGHFYTKSYIDKQTPLRIDLPEGSSSVWVRYYRRDFPVALPPFMEQDPVVFDYEADSLFSIAAPEGLTPVIFLSAPGFYHFQPDTNLRNGLTLYNFYPGFPDIITENQLLEPLRYITTNKEFQEMAGSNPVKIAIDQFWLKNGGNPMRARNMISRYYGRVRDANEYFTSYIEGWKTDRGLIYIVFGPPGIVYRADGIEEWIYGEAGNSNSLRFQFVKMDNPFTHNDYALIKSLTVKEKWFDAVSAWRR